MYDAELTLEDGESISIHTANGTIGVYMNTGKDELGNNATVVAVALNRTGETDDWCLEVGQRGTNLTRQTDDFKVEPPTERPMTSKELGESVGKPVVSVIRDYDGDQAPNKNEWARNPNNPPGTPGQQEPPPSHSGAEPE